MLPFFFNGLNVTLKYWPSDITLNDHPFLDKFKVKSVNHTICCLKLANSVCKLTSENSLFTGRIYTKYTIFRLRLDNKTTEIR